MLAASTTLQYAQTVKEYLQNKKLLHAEYLPVKELGFMYFPMNKKVKIPHAEVVEAKITFPQKIKPFTIEQVLAKKLTPHELTLIPRTQEIVGDILIIEIPPELKQKEHLIAEAYLQVTKHIQTVVKKEYMHTGEFRTRKVRILAGKLTKETIHHESGVKLKLHVEKTYFSSRSGHERLRLAQQVKKGELILVMFSGVGPYPLVLARNTEAKKIYGIELNPFAHYYAVQNVELNNLSSKVIIMEGDVRTLIPKLKQTFDRIIMPLPKTGEEFLPVAFSKAKRGTIIHLYSFLPETEIVKYARHLREKCKQLGHPVRLLRNVKCGQFSPGTFRVCFDMKML
ncbi:MAG: class I SAM-dependent methyltransferase family protein [Nanoarchaeota archaeon]